MLSPTKIAIIFGILLLGVLIAYCLRKKSITEGYVDLETSSRTIVTDMCNSDEQLYRTVETIGIPVLKNELDDIANTN